MPSRIEVVQTCLNFFEAPRYLEIGVNQGETFHALTAHRKVAVDPHFAFPPEARQAGSDYHEVTSDVFFGSLHDGARFDVIYIDGLHTFEQTLKDLLSAQLVLTETGVIVIDDVLPNSFDSSIADLSQVFALRQEVAALPVRWEMDGSWMGDVFKVVFFISQFMQQVSYATVSDNHGQTVLWRQPRAAEVLPEANAEAVARLDFRDTILRRSVFNLRPFADIAAEIEALRRPPPAPEAAPRSDHRVPFSILAPAQSLPMPAVSFPERMSSLISDFQNEVWGAQRAEKTIQVRRLENVCVVGQGVVFQADGQLIESTTAKMTPHEIGLSVQAFAAAGAAGVGRISGPHLLCGQAGIPNYGHWMVDILPIPYLMQRQAPAEPWAAYVPQMFPATRAIVRESLALLGVDEGRRLEGDGEPLWFDELIVVTGLTQHGKYILPVTTECLRAIAHDVEPDGGERVWISRLGQARALACEGELTRRLLSLGWRVLLPTGMTLRQQIAACKGARVMAGVDGAGLTNMGFMPAGGRVTSFRPAHMPDTFFYQLAVNGDLAYHDVGCLTSEPVDGDIPWNVELQLGVEDVLAFLG